MKVSARSWQWPAHHLGSDPGMLARHHRRFIDTGLRSHLPPRHCWRSPWFFLTPSMRDRLASPRAYLRRRARQHQNSHAHESSLNVTRPLNRDRPERRQSRLRPTIRWCYVNGAIKAPGGKHETMETWELRRHTQRNSKKWNGKKWKGKVLAPRPKRMGQECGRYSGGGMGRGPQTWGI